MSNLDAPAKPELRDLPRFVADIHIASGELTSLLEAGVVPSTRDWMTFVDLFCAAQLLWWHHRGGPSVRRP